jgi:solute carrier family 13 (sodium-dependent dicarboxylate transporter), member 2/3/5
LLPIALAAIEESADRRLRTCVLLGVAYAASIGGIGTPIGTPPNLVFMKFYTEVAGGQEPSFTTWMSWAMPTMLIMLPATGLWLTRGLKSSGILATPAVEHWRYQEIATLIVFALTAALWITRKEPWGGWSEWLGLPGASDASVALLAVIAMHLLPDGKGESLLTWDDAKRIPWGVLILYGGGIAIAKAFDQSGLDDLIASSLTGLTHVPVLLMIALVCLSVTFLTEVTSNTATANLVLPILAATALAAAIDPRLIMVPATISASFAFMLPVGTPPNAIVYGTGDVTIEQMAREGFVINLIGVVVVTVVCYFTFL